VLSAEAKLVWMEDWTMDRGGEGCWLSHGQLGERLGMSESAVQAQRNNLEKLGLYERIKRPGARSPGWRPRVPEQCHLASQRPKPEDVARARTFLDLELQRPSARPQSDWTYFIRVGAGAVKIGRSDDVDRRLRELQAANADPVRLLLKTKAIREGDAHRRWAHLRQRGEWFAAGDDLLDWLASASGGGTDTLETARRTRPRDVPVPVSGTVRSVLSTAFDSQAVKQPSTALDSEGNRVSSIEQGQEAIDGHTGEGPILPQNGHSDSKLSSDLDPKPRPIDERPRQEVEEEGWERLRARHAEKRRQAGLG
jgi:hypothetical protein